MRHAGHVALALLALGAGTLAPAAAETVPPTPILVTAMVHVDPLPTVNDVNAALRAYAEHRDAWLWYLELANRTGLRISAQMTGVYAEACVREGDAADFASCMPGGPHHLGTHLHANVKGTGPYVWKTVSGALMHDPSTVVQVFSDNLPWVNRVFEANGFGTADNWFFHGSHATFPEMDDVLFDPARGHPYANRYRMVGATRGCRYLYRGDFLLEPDQEAGPFIKMAEVGGIIGEDRPHGPEGLVLGTVPFQRRDFLAAYIEWREGVRRGACGPVRHFTWMVHPYQLTPGHLGSDGRPTRDSIEELVAWLRESFIGRTDDTGAVVARFANAAEIAAGFEAWEAACPAAAEQLQGRMAAGEHLRYLPAILDRMASTSHLEVLDLHPSLTAHRLRDIATGKDAVLVWALGTATVPLDGLLWQRVRVTRGDGTVTELDAVGFSIDAEPILVEEAPGQGGPARPPRRRLSGGGA